MKVDVYSHLESLPGRLKYAAILNKANRGGTRHALYPT